MVRVDGAVYVLHRFQKKTPETSKTDEDMAENRYRDLMMEMGK